MIWDSGFESRIEFISKTAPGIRALKTDVRTRCDRDHDFQLDGASEHNPEIFDSNHFKPGLFVQRLGDVGLDQEFVFSDPIASIAVPGLQNTSHLPVGIDIYGFLHMKIEDLGFGGSTIRPTSANVATRNGGDDTLWRDYQIRGLAGYNGLPDLDHIQVYPEGYEQPDMRFFEFFGKQEMRFGNMISGIHDLIRDVRLVARGFYVGSVLCPRLYMSLTIRGVEVIAPIRVPFSLTKSTIYGPWVDVTDHGWTFDDDIRDIADTYLTVDGRHSGSLNNLNLTQARLELRTGVAEFLDYHVSLVRGNDGKLFTSSQPQSSWNRDWFWLPLDVIDSSSLGGALLTRIQLYKDNYTEANGKITVKELILYGR